MERQVHAGLTLSAEKSSRIKRKAIQQNRPETHELLPLLKSQRKLRQKLGQNFVSVNLPYGKQKVFISLD